MGVFSGTLNGSLNDKRLFLSAFSSAPRELPRGSGSETMRCLDALRESLCRKALSGADFGRAEDFASLNEGLWRTCVVIIFSCTRLLLILFRDGPIGLIGRWAS